MNAKDYDNFLIETASKIDALTVQQGNRQHFQRQVNLFLDGVNNWYEAYKDGLEQAKSNPKLFIGKYSTDDESEKEWLESIRNNENVEEKWKESKREKTPQGYEFVDPNYDYYPYFNNIIEKSKGYYYRKPLPPNPLDTLIPKDDMKELFPENKREVPMIERPPIDTQEDVLRKYYLLAVIHAHKVSSPPFIDKESYSAVLIWDVYGDLNDTRKAMYWGKHIETLIISAIGNVAAGINGQLAVHAKGRKPLKKIISLILQNRSDLMNSPTQLLPLVNAELKKLHHDPIKVPSLKNSLREIRSNRK